MEESERALKDLIIERYGSLNKFCETIDMPWTTLDSILKRGVSKANITNIIKITHELNLDTESLASGILSPKKSTPSTIAAHFDGVEYSEAELEKIKEYAAFIKSTRKNS